jgi:hypothetical protein
MYDAGFQAASKPRLRRPGRAVVRPSPWMNRLLPFMTRHYPLTTFPNCPQQFCWPLLPLLALSCLFSFPIEKVHASCGDHLHTKSDVRSRQARTDQAEQVGSILRMWASDSRPCRGPTCRSQMPRPEPVAPFAGSSSTDKYAVFRVGDTADDCRPCFYFEPTTLLASEGFPFLVDRPPALTL